MRPAYLAFVLAIASGPTGAQTTTGAAPIDAELSGQLDFRAIEFKQCFDNTTCEVNGIRISGFRSNALNGELEPARLYWDPIDGIGVTQGDQNDEIDFDERIIVELPETRRIARVWLSDLFIAEHRRFGGVSVSGEDAEHARMEMALDGTVVGDIRISGEDVLPNDPFDVLVNGSLIESGDLRRRVIVDERTKALIIPGVGPAGSDIVIDISPGVVDEDKKDIFEGVPTVEIEITDILREFIDAPILAAGTHNANQILAVLEDDARLSQIYDGAKETRVISDRKNGEIAGVLDTPLEVDSLTFYTPFDTSNDYSVAGVVFEPGAALQ